MKQLLLIVFCTIFSLTACTNTQTILQKNTKAIVSQEKKSVTTPKKEISAPIKKEIVPPKPKPKPKITGRVYVAGEFKGMTFTDVVAREGIPFENIIPRKKEQVVIYKKNEYYIFYYLKKNVVNAIVEYSIADIEEIKKQNKYPEQVFRDLNV